MPRPWVCLSFGPRHRLGAGVSCHLCSVCVVCHVMYVACAGPCLAGQITSPASQSARSPLLPLNLPDHLSCLSPLVAVDPGRPVQPSPLVGIEPRTMGGSDWPRGGHCSRHKHILPSPLSDFDPVTHRFVGTSVLTTVARVRDNQIWL